jgi:aspartate ammonia-lyase
MGLRVERDSLGSRKVPSSAYFGVFSLRAKENFFLSGSVSSKELMCALGLVKEACAKTNGQLGFLSGKKATAIINASKEFQKGVFASDFLLDYFQAGAGTPFNMNCNEIIANRASELLGKKKGSYFVHPNNDVNCSQSSNDVMPTVARIVLLMHSKKLLEETCSLEKELLKKSKEFGGVLKCGRTHFMDAVPITLGQEFSGYSARINSSKKQLQSAVNELLFVPLGGSAVGTGINTHPQYRKMVVKELSSLSGFKLCCAKNSFELMHSFNAFLLYSNALRLVAVDLQKICDDLMFLGSGPSAGINEVFLPQVQPGSSIMPGKVNPSILEAVKMVCFKVHGNDLTVSMAAQAGVLEINVNAPVVIHSLEESTSLLTNAVRLLCSKCIKGLRANEKRCFELLEKSSITATALNPYLGYEKVAELVKEAVEKNVSVREIVLQKKLLDKKTLDEVFDFKKMVAPQKR